MPLKSQGINLVRQTWSVSRIALFLTSRNNAQNEELTWSERVRELLKQRLGIFNVARNIYLMIGTKKRLLSMFDYQHILYDHL